MLQCVEVFDSLVDNIESENPNGFLGFIDAPGGTGKTFVLNTLLAKYRSQGHVALACAFSGVAALLLEGGCTVHKRFNVRPNMPKERQFTIKRGSALAKLMKLAKVIVIDEAPMMDVYIMESIDATLRDIFESDKAFGGLPIILAGDFRQILPVVKNCNSPQTLMDHCLKRSDLWEDVRCFRLKDNMRVLLKHGNPEFADWLIRVGDQDCEEVIFEPDIKQREYHKYISLPTEWSMDSKASDLDGFIEEMFPNMNERYDENGELKTVSILTPYNKNMHLINSKCIGRFPGQQITRRSIDSATLANDDIDELAMPMELLNNLPTPSGMAPHLLELKKYCPLVILKNLNVNQGLCNGTRCILLEIKRYSLRVRLLHNGKEAFIPRIKMIEPDKFGFTLNRIQFPVQLAFAMSINKAQVRT